MMLRVDDQLVASQQPTLASALHAARESVELQGRVIIEVLLDGQPVPDADLASPDQSTIAGRELTCRTALPSELVSASLLGAADRLETLIAEQTTIAGLIDRSEIEAAMKQLGTALAAWDQVDRVLKSAAALLSVDLETLAIAPDHQPDAPPVQIGRACQTLYATLSELKRCLAAQDWPGLSDLLLFDLQDQARLWQSIFRAWTTTILQTR